MGHSDLSFMLKRKNNHDGLGLIMISTDVLVIGAGMAGLTLALGLMAKGKQVVCVDKARGSGGRLSSKRLQNPEHVVSFDLGALSFTASTPEFNRAVNEWCQIGQLAPWQVTDANMEYVGTPRSSSLTRFLSVKVGVKFDVKVTKLLKHEDLWRVYVDTDDGEQLYALTKEIVLACPAPQAYALTPEGYDIKNLLQDISIDPQWVVMLALEDALSIPNLCKTPNENIMRISYENSKPGRNNQHGLHVYCVQASQSWSKLRVDDSKESIIHELANELSTLCPEPFIIKSDYAHRWLYSQNSSLSHLENPFITSNDGLHVCGDYLIKKPNIDGVEAAYLSGYALARDMNRLEKTRDEEPLI